ncbi:MAG: nuclear transport factor 2 family protein [Rubricoccaceae bacterium]|nr:nuclear transport factor 2 family protein [Rubricoccaceae bacterium]
MANTDTVESLRRFIRELNDTWRAQRYEDLASFFHNDVVLLPPGSEEPVESVEAIVESYRQFGASATIHSFTIEQIRVYDFKTVALCQMGFDIDYEIESGRYREHGMEVYVVENSGHDPKIIWRTQVLLD